MGVSIEALQNQLNAIQEAVNYNCRQNEYAIGLQLRILELLQPPPSMRLAVGLIIRQQSGELLSMSGSNPTPIQLTNAANPAQATFFRGIIDFSGGTALPTLSVTSGTPSLVAIVPATAAGPMATQFLFNVYPVDTNEEAADLVTVTATLPDGATLAFLFSISGTGESMTEDSSSGVQGWANAPTVPTAPV